LANYLSAEEINQFRQSGTGIYSVTVYADKLLKEKTCCEPGCCSN
jgi:arsenite methyltransferase